MDELIKTVSEKAGINPEQARSAINSVMEFVKAKLPMIGDQLKGMLEGGGGGASSAVDAIKSKLGLG